MSHNVDRGIDNVSGSSGSQPKGEPKPIGYFAWNLAIRVPLIFSALRELGATSLRALQGEVNTISNKSTWPSSDEQMFIGIGDPLLDGKGSQRGGSMWPQRALRRSTPSALCRDCWARVASWIAEGETLGANMQNSLLWKERATKPWVMKLNRNRLRGNDQLADFARRLNPTRSTKLLCDSEEACSYQRL